MPVLRVLLLVAISIGLQLPGGIEFRLCLCQGLAAIFHSHGEVTRGGCCAEESEDSGCGPDQCCGGSDRAAEPDHEQDCCGCFQLKTPGHPQSNLPPRGVSIALPAVSGLVVTCTLPLRREIHVSLAERGHDPPWERRNLLLRI